MTHTPGPWKFERHNAGSQWLGNIVSYGLGRDELGTQQIRTIDCLRRGAPEDEMVATAHLIAAAPDMLAALLEIQAQLECPARNTNRGRAYREGVTISHDVREMVRAAIAKATAVSSDKP